LNKLVNVGFGNVVNSSKIIGIISPEAAPIKRLVQTAKDTGMAIDATCGRRTKAVIVVESGHLILSSLLPETIAGRVNQKEMADNQETVAAD
jgi:extracellular matrix regulatory protein A